MKHHRTICFLLFLFLPGLLLGLGFPKPPSAFAGSEYQQFHTLNVSVPTGIEILSGSVALALMLHHRWRPEREDLGIYRFAIDYEIGPIRTRVGYTYVPIFHHRPTVHEHRAFQQTMWNFPLTDDKGVRFIGQLLLEARWRDGLPGTATRFRPRIGVVLPLPKVQSLAFQVWNETLLQPTRASWSAPEFYEENRLQLGPNWGVNPHLNLFAGYLWINQRGQHAHAFHIQADVRI